MRIGYCIIGEQKMQTISNDEVLERIEILKSIFFNDVCRGWLEIGDTREAYDGTTKMDISARYTKGYVAFSTVCMIASQVPEWVWIYSVGMSQGEFAIQMELSI